MKTPHHGWRWLSNRGVHSSQSLSLQRQLKLSNHICLSVFLTLLVISIALWVSGLGNYAWPSIAFMFLCTGALALNHLGSTILNRSFTSILLPGFVFLMTIAVSTPVNTYFFLPGIVLHIQLIIVSSILLPLTLFSGKERLWPWLTTLLIMVAALFIKEAIQWNDSNIWLPPNHLVEWSSMLIIAGIIISLAFYVQKSFRQELASQKAQLDQTQAILENQLRENAQKESFLTASSQEADILKDEILKLKTALKEKTELSPEQLMADAITSTLPVPVKDIQQDLTLLEDNLQAIAGIYKLLEEIDEQLPITQYAQEQQVDFKLLETKALTEGINEKCLQLRKSIHFLQKQAALSKVEKTNRSYPDLIDSVLQECGPPEKVRIIKDYEEIEEFACLPQFEIALYNLFRFALERIEDKGKLYLHLQMAEADPAEAPTTELTLRINGKHLEAGELEALINPYTALLQKDKGLVVCYSVVQQHQGKLTFGSPSEGVLEIFLRLPFQHCVLSPML
ncbi:hypothetical protein AAG747_18775 [Rapidithrix thailandica]|uniref:Histidine kinase domain-containing protein n=1 Tax=Rapidithrix thailandica TaxID=413964 RepID=A0AAW9S1K0_9BACT